jgi:CRISPR system Cascade subunit CasD
MSEMRTLALNLSGPLQSWGSINKFRTRDTLPYPSLSGLYGLARAALGHGRETPLEEVRWLMNLKMAVRIDDKGKVFSDYHTINEYPKILGADALFSKKEQTKKVPTGSGKPWAASSTLITERAYRTDATYLWLIEGREQEIDQLAYAFFSPEWQLSLGRKKCIPDWLFVLGETESSIMDAANSIPYVSRSKKDKPVELHLLTNDVIVAGEKGIPITLPDSPLGSHPHDGYTQNNRYSIWVSPPKGTREDILAWAKKHTHKYSSLRTQHEQFK